MRLSAKVGAIEFVGDEVRVAVVKTGGRLPKVLALGRARAVYAEDGERPEALAAAVRQALGQVSPRPAVYVLSVSSAWSVVRMLTIPFRGRRQVAAAVQFELEPYLAFPIEELVVDFIPVREVDKQTEVLVVGVRREVIEGQIAILGEAGVTVEGVGLDAVGLTHLWHGAQGGAPGVQAVVHIREEGAAVAMVRGKKLVSIRHLAIPSAQFHENPSGAARDVFNILRAFSAGRGEYEEVTSLSVTGAHFFHDEQSLFENEINVPIQFQGLMANLKGVAAAIPGSDDLHEPSAVPVEDGSAGRVDAHEATLGSDELYEPFGVPVEDGSAGRVGAQNGEDEGEEWAACVGVAAAAASGSFSLDFCKDGVNPAQSWRRLVGHGVFTSILALLVLAGYVGYCYVDYRHNVVETQEVARHVWEEFAAAFPQSEAVKNGPPAGDVGGFKILELVENEAEKDSQSGKTYSIDTFSRPVLLDILMELAAKVPDKTASITNLKITVGKTMKITVYGEVNDTTKFDEVVLPGLERSTVFNVDIDRLDRKSIKGQERFVLTATR